MSTVDVCETFVSLQGESSYAGLPCFFIRLAGCNLKCRYCDTPEAMQPGRTLSVEVLVEEAEQSHAPMVEITGGEPLLQAGFAELAGTLASRMQKPVLVETNGSLDISVIPAGVTAIMDVKCPGSGEEDSLDRKNLERLRPYDEVKFVLSNEADYDWAKKFVGTHRLSARCRTIFFSPVLGQLEPRKLWEWLTRDRLPVRMQVQLHKLLGMK